MLETGVFYVNNMQRATGVMNACFLVQRMFFVRIYFINGWLQFQRVFFLVTTGILMSTRNWQRTTDVFEVHHTCQLLAGYPFFFGQIFYVRPKSCVQRPVSCVPSPVCPNCTEFCSFRFLFLTSPLYIHSQIPIIHPFPFLRWAPNPSSCDSDWFSTVSFVLLLTFHCSS